MSPGIIYDLPNFIQCAFRESENASVWHEDVQMFSVYDKKTDELIGDFYLDMFQGQINIVMQQHLGLEVVS